jgi:hypothetical protein
MEIQLAIVLLIVAAAAVYAGRSLLRQFSVGADESDGCATCSAAEGPEVEVDSSDEAGPLVGLSRIGSD